MTKLPVLLFALAASVTAADIAGVWRLNIVSFGEEVAPARLEIKVDGNKLTGTLNAIKVEGTIENGILKFTGSRPSGDQFATFEGRLSGSELRGTAQMGTETREWIGRRSVLPTAAPQTRTFEPTAFHRLFSGTIPPVLHINPGDTVRTTTVDAGGRDAQNVRLSNGGNPETGPFYVEGAMPGDTLVVKFNRIRLNRDSAGSGGRIVPTALGPGYFRDAKFDDKLSTA